MKTGKIQTEVPNMETKYFVAHFVNITIFKVLLHYGQAFDTTARVLSVQQNSTLNMVKEISPSRTAS